MLSWANRFSICCFLDNNQYQGNYHSYEWMMAAEAVSFFSPSENILPALHEYCMLQQEWLFGHISYDLRSETEDVRPYKEDPLHFPDIYLFLPAILIFCKDDNVVISSIQCPDTIYEQIISTQVIDADILTQNITVRSKFTKEEYLSTIEKLRKHILRGDCYEINFCIEFFADKVSVDALSVYKQLIKISPNPFSCFYKLYDKYLLCASPERYMRKEGNTIISQPVKGTIKRNASPAQDEQNKMHLLQSGKNRSENVMVVDLVRNDLSKICKNGSVHADELFGIYSFPQLHQMISTVKGELKDDTTFADILKATFPMGSMTGAPKKRVMELISQYERSKRGIFSGAVGYITPDGDFDFNVVIRSIMYNATNKYLSYQVGSGITFYSNAEEEYEECLLKAKAIEQVLL